MPHPTAGPATVFVSYAHADARFVLHLVEDLRQLGIAVWTDQDIPPGSTWDSNIEQAIKDCSKLIVVMSPRAVASQEVSNEWSYARDDGDLVIPVLYESCDIPMRLKRLQYVDFTTDYDSALAMLGARLRAGTASTLQPTAQSQRAAAPRRRPSHALVGSASAALVVLGLGLWLLWSNKRNPPPAVVSQTKPAQPFSLRVGVESKATDDRKDPHPNLSFLQRKPPGDYEVVVAFQPRIRQYEVPSILLPAAGNHFEAEFRPMEFDATERTTESVAQKLCFMLNLTTTQQPVRNFAQMTCSEPAGCRVDSADPGWARDCASQVGWFGKARTPERFFWSQFVAEAHAATSQHHWSVPALPTLEARQVNPADDPPYTRFRITAPAVANAPWASRQYFTFAISVNSVPVYVDGWKPGEHIVRNASGAGFALEFGLQNLGFSGEHRTSKTTAAFANATAGLGDTSEIGGVERLEVRLYWLARPDASLASAVTVALERDIVSFRDAEILHAKAHGVDFTWSGEYRPSKRNDRFSIFAASPGSASEAQSVKSLIDQAAVEFASGRVVGVVRAPLRQWRLQPWSNDRYAVLLGIKEKSGQIRFGYQEQEASQLCGFIVRERSRFPDRTGHSSAIHQSVYRYEWPPPGQPRLARQQVPCQQLKG